MTSEAEGAGDAQEFDVDDAVADGQEPDAPEGDEAEEPEEPAEPEVHPEVAKLQKLNEDKKVALRVERNEKRRFETEAKSWREKYEALAAERELSERPDPDSDPIGHIKWLEQKFSKPQKAAEPAQNDVHTQLADLQAEETEYAAENPDYTPAAEFLGEKLRGDLEAQGYTGKELDNAFGQQLLNLVAGARKAGKHPGDVVMELAKRNGFQKVDKGAQKIDTMRKATAETSLSSARSTSGSKELTYSYVAGLKLGSPEREKAMSQLREQERRKA